MGNRINGVAVLLAAVLLAGCARSVAGTAETEQWSPTRAAGLEITSGQSGPRPGVPDTGLTAVNGDGGEIDRLALNAVEDVQRYWAQELPATFGVPFAPVRRLFSYDSTGPGPVVCGTDTTGLANAFYCPAEDTVAWDRGELLPTLADTFGTMSVVAVLAHEFGHAVQFRLGVGGSTSSIVREQQADCYTGAFFRWLAEGNGPHYRLATGPGLNQVLGTLFFIRDSTEVGFDTDGAHGNAFDRVSAFQFGFGDGSGRCARIDETEVRGRITQQSAAAVVPGDDGNLPVDDPDALAALLSTLRAAFGPNTAPIVGTTVADCPEGGRTAPVSYCPATGTLGLDLAGLAAIGTARSDGGDGIGDFAAFAEIASRYALAVQQAAGLPLRGVAAAGRTACLTGFWAGTITAGRGAPLTLSPGDLDEAVAEMLAPESLIAADVDGRSIPSGFARVQAFREGFAAADPAACADLFR